MKKDIKTIWQKLNWFRGTIISAATEIESALTWRLRTYFYPKTNRQASIFHYRVLDASYFTFDKKITLYEQIPIFKKAKRYTKIKESLRFIQKLRNAVAHWHLYEKISSGGEIVILNPITFEKLKLNDKLMVKFYEYEKFLLKIFGWEQTLRERYGK